MTTRALVPRTRASLVRPPDIESARRYAAAGKSEATRRSYRKDWDAFATWCASHNLQPMPAAPDTVALYCAARADGGAKPGYITRMLASISQAHQALGHASPWSSAEVRAVMAGIRNTLGTDQRKVRPLLLDNLRAMVATQGTDLIGLRNRALLLVGFFGALRRAELVGIEVPHVRFCDEGMEITLPRSKTSQSSATLICIPKTPDPLCAVAALKRWLFISSVTSGPVYRGISRRTVPGPKGLAGTDVARIIKSLCVLAGIDPTDYAGHSLRSGLVTQADMLGVPYSVIMGQTRHTNLQMLGKYIRRQNPWQDNVVRAMGL